VELNDNRRRLKEAERAQRLIDLWRERPKSERTGEDVLTFYGWLAEHEPGLIPGDVGHGSSLKQLRAILTPHLVEDA